MAPWIEANRPQPRIVVLAPPDKPKVATELDRLLPILEQHAEILHVDQHFEYQFESCSADFVVVLGGDGSILQAARQMGRFQLPVLGVNLGRLGFLAALPPDRLIDVWPEVCSGRYSITKHLMFDCEVYEGDMLVHRLLGLNEASILGGPPYSMLQIELFIDSMLATTYACDGLIISTPIGSTAHNLSAGGPILRKNLQAFVISPISPHTLTMRPVVDTSDRIFEIRINTDHPSANVVVDGRVLCQLGVQHRVRIQKANSTFELIAVPGQNDYATLRKKLGWSGSPTGIHSDFRQD